MSSQSTDEAVAKGHPVATAPSFTDEGMRRDFELEKLRNEMRREAEASARLAALEKNAISQDGKNSEGRSNPTVVLASSERYCGWKSWLCCVLCVFPCIACCPLDTRRPSVVVAA